CQNDSAGGRLPPPAPWITDTALMLAAEAAAAAKSAATAEAAAAAGTTAAGTAGTTGTRTALAEHRLGLHRDQAFALHALARQLAGAAYRLRLLTSPLFRWLFVMAA